MRSPVNVLLVATRSPYPPRDGGAVLVANTIQGLASRGHEITLVAPAYEGNAGGSMPRDPLVHLHLVPATPRSLPAALAASVVQRRPVSIERHVQAPVALAVARLLTEKRFDVVHVEQLQALAQAEPAFARRLPVVLRAQNVESDLWRMLSIARRGWRIVAAHEARRLARWEAAAVGRVTMTVALTPRDAHTLRRLAPPGTRVRLIRMPMPAVLPARAEALPGSPSIALLASGAWFPNRDGVTWFLRDVWPTVSRGLPESRLHVFGLADRPASAPGAHFHAAPGDSGDAFVRDSILAVPLRIASGARVRILEAWARGVPVVATPAAAAGLDLHERRGLLMARTPDEFLAAFRDLTGSPERAREMVADGRAVLRQWHEPDQLAGELEQVYLEAIEASAARAD